MRMSATSALSFSGTATRPVLGSMQRRAISPSMRASHISSSALGGVPAVGCRPIGEPPSWSAPQRTGSTYRDRQPHEEVAVHVGLTQRSPGSMSLHVPPLLPIRWVEAVSPCACRAKSPPTSIPAVHAQVPVEIGAGKVARSDDGHNPVKTRAPAAPHSRGEKVSGIFLELAHDHRPASATTLSPAGCAASNCARRKIASA